LPQKYHFSSYLKIHLTRPALCESADEPKKAFEMESRKMAGAKGKINFKAN
jgi:hypothetical protein